MAVQTGHVRITEVEVKDLLRIKYVKVVPQGSTVIVGGDNDQGKSSFLDAIAFALGGTKLCPAEPIRRGKLRGRVGIKLDSDHPLLPGPCTVSRVFEKRPDGSWRSELLIESDDGFAAPSPQTILNDLLSKSAFDPMEFLNLKPKEQVNRLATLLGVDVAAFDARRESVYAKRTEVNRQLKQQEQVVAAITVPKDAPDEEVSMLALVDELNSAIAHNSQVDELSRASAQAVAAAKAAEREVEKVQSGIDGLREQIKELETRIANGEVMLAEKQTAMSEARTAADAAIEREKAAVKADTTALRQRLGTIEAANAAVRVKKKKQEAMAAANELRKAAEKLSDAIADVDAEKQEAIAAAKFPVEGLRFTDTGLILNDLPFEQASTSKKIRVAVAMGLAANPALKLLIIREGSDLDEGNLALVASVATEYGGQLFIERVSKGAECSVIIKDGEAVNAQGGDDEAMDQPTENGQGE